MFEFPCPTCGKRVQGDDALAGKLVLCPGCNATLTAPGSVPLTNATAITDSEMPRPPRPREDDAFGEERTLSVRKPNTTLLARVLAIVAGVVCLICIVGLLVPRVSRVHVGAARTQSVNNLKQIGLAAQSFHDAHERLPFNGDVPAKPNDPTSGSWLFQILPWIDQQALFKVPQVGHGIQAYLCPGCGRPSHCTTGAWSDYMINSWINDDQNGAANAPDVKRTLLEITDGSSNTIFAGHGTIDRDLYASSIAHAQSTDIFKGGDPALARHATINKRDELKDAARNWGGPFPQGSLMVWCDGTVRMVPYSTPAGENIINGVGVSIFAAYLTPRGGEAVPLPD